MKNVGYEIHRIIEDKHLVKKQIAEKLGMSASQFVQMRRKSNLDCATLEKLCNIVGINPLYFFDEWNGGGISVGDISNSSVAGDATVNVGAQRQTEQVLRDLLAEKERMIQVLLKQTGMSETLSL